MAVDKDKHPCENCGMCCMHMATPPFVGLGMLRKECPEDAPAPDHEKRIYAWLDSPRRKWADHQPCIWLNRINGQCIHHGVRPMICREFEIGGEACNAYRAQVGLAPAPRTPNQE